MVFYEKMQTDDITNGEGISVSIWFRGCPHKCKGCHNPYLWNYGVGGVNIALIVCCDRFEIFK